MKILVVDDVAYSRLIVRKALERFAFVIVEAESGAAALRVLQTEPDIDLVVSDLVMPDMNGIELIGRTKALDPGSKAVTFFPPPFILLTASPRPDLVRKAKQTGFVDVMVKPLDPQRLLRTIQKYLPVELETGKAYSEALQEVDGAVAEVLATKDRAAAREILKALRTGADRLDVFLDGAGEEEDPGPLEEVQ